MALAKTIGVGAGTDMAIMVSGDLVQDDRNQFD